MKLLLDNLDDRREVWRLLHRLPPSERIGFLRSCCRRVSNRGRNPTPDPLKYPVLVRDASRSDRDDERLTSEVYLDFWMLVFDYSLDHVSAARELEASVRRSR